MTLPDALGPCSRPDEMPGRSPSAAHHDAAAVGLPVARAALAEAVDRIKRQNDRPRHDTPPPPWPLRQERNQ